MGQAWNINEEYNTPGLHSLLKSLRWSQWEINASNGWENTVEIVSEKIWFMNRKCQTVSGFSQEDWKGKNII